jgi:serine O-acetyltransferase
MSRNNADIPLIARIDGMPVFPHGLSGIFLSNGAKIGKNCVIFHQVTIGSNSLPDSPGHGAPVIGDDVYIGCGAKIIGNVRVGSNVRIGANCVVTRDVPDNATVVLEKPRVIVHAEPRDNRLVVFTGENR